MTSLARIRIRVKRLETDMEHFNEDLNDLKTDVEEAVNNIVENQPLDNNKEN